MSERSSKNYQLLINNGRWQKLRLKKVKASPLCERCLEMGITKETEEVHHIKPVESTTDPSKMKELAYDYDNLQSLCKVCHGQVHIEMREKRESKRVKYLKENVGEDTRDFFKDFLE